MGWGGHVSTPQRGQYGASLPDSPAVRHSRRTQVGPAKDDTRVSASNPVDLHSGKAFQMSYSSHFPRGKLALAIMFHQLTRGRVETSKWLGVRVCVSVCV